MIAADSKPASPRSEPRPAHERVVAARAQLFRDGLTTVAWAKANGENPELVAKVLTGTRPCVRGDSRRIAIKLSIVDPVPGADTEIPGDRPTVSQGE